MEELGSTPKNSSLIVIEEGFSESVRAFLESTHFVVAFSTTWKIVR
jgi:hypothetical protein